MLADNDAREIVSEERTHRVIDAADGRAKRRRIGVGLRRVVPGSGDEGVGRRQSIALPPGEGGQRQAADEHEADERFGSHRIEATMRRG